MYMNTPAAGLDLLYMTSHRQSSINPYTALAGDYYNADTFA